MAPVASLLQWRLWLRSQLYSRRVLISGNPAGAMAMEDLKGICVDIYISYIYIYIYTHTFIYRYIYIYGYYILYAGFHMRLNKTNQPWLVFRSNHWPKGRSFSDDFSIFSDVLWNERLKFKWRCPKTGVPLERHPFIDGEIPNRK
jgi:hypothetical protein